MKIIETFKTPNVSERKGKIRMIILHSTEGQLQGALSWLCNKESKVSAHYVIARNGTIYKLAPLSMATWHTKGKWNTGEHYNDISIGIELERYGQLDYTMQQYEALAELVSVLLQSYDITTITSHAELDPNRRSDPVNFNWRVFWITLLTQEARRNEQQETKDR
jgi:N-acetylmuramoyl-L-alanine amidase